MAKSPNFLKAAFLLPANLVGLATAAASSAMTGSETLALTIEDLMRLTHEQSIAIRDPEAVNRQLEALGAEAHATDETAREMERFLEFGEEVRGPLPHGTRVR